MTQGLVIQPERQSRAVIDRTGLTSHREDALFLRDLQHGIQRSYHGVIGRNENGIDSGQSLGGLLDFGGVSDGFFHHFQTLLLSFSFRQFDLYLRVYLTRRVDNANLMSIGNHLFDQVNLFRHRIHIRSAGHVVTRRLVRFHQLRCHRIRHRREQYRGIDHVLGNGLSHGGGDSKPAAYFEAMEFTLVWSPWALEAS